MATLPGELLQVCTLGDLETLYMLLSQQTDPASLVNLTSEGDVTLLMHTIIGAGTSDPSHSGRYEECCSLLIQAGAELETADATYGRTAAHWAVYYHRDDILSHLIEAACDMTCPDYSGTSPFHLAIQESATKCLHASLQLLPREILALPHPQFLLPLLHAVQSGNKEACLLLVQAGADVNQGDEESGRGPLHFATESNNGVLVDFLIECGSLLDVMDARGLMPLHIASIVEGVESLGAIIKRVGGEELLDIRDSRGLTPLMHACLYGNVDSVRLLLKKKADAMLQDSEGKHCLHYAAESSAQSAHECVQLILKRHKSLLDSADSLGRTPLHTCAMSGTVDTLELLLASGCSLDMLDSSQRGAGHWAAVNGNPPVLAKLLELGSPVDALDALGSTPLHYACEQSAEPTAEVFSEEALSRSLLVQECVGILLKGGASMEHHDAQGLLPLHSALQLHNNLSACHLLLGQGADAEARTDVEGMTGLHLAARAGVAESCQYLLDHTGGRLGTMEDQEGASALHHAVRSGAVECVQYLLQAGLSPDHANKEQRTPAHLAATAGLTPCLQLLKGYGANLGATDVDGATPLHGAAANGHAGAVELLASSHEDSVNMGVEQSQATPLHYAVQGSHDECVQLLLERGAKVNSITVSDEGEQLSPLDLSEPDTNIHNMLTQHGGLPGTGIAKQLTDKVAESAFLQGETEAAAGDRDLATGSPADEETLSIPSVRPATPSRRSFVGDPIFETDQPDYAATSQHPSRIPTPVSPPPAPEEVIRQGPGILKKMFSMLRKKSSQMPQDSIMSSVVGFYAAQMTLLAAAVVGTPLGDKVREVAEKVATDTAEELKKSAALHEEEFPELVWLQEETDGPRATPTPTPSPPPTPPPSTPPPPIPKATEDPYERRLRKAKAQLDMSKSPGFLAVEELLKAQDTHMKLKRQFQEEQVKEAIATRRQNFQAEEMKAKKASEKVMRRFEERMNRVNTESDEVTRGIEEQLSHAREQNQELSSVMGAIGVNPRPTVAQWLQRKQIERRARLQDSLINWDTGRRRREAAILVEQALVSQRVMKHAAWGANKEIRSKIKAVKKSPYNASINLPRGHPVPTPQGGQKPRGVQDTRQGEAGKLETPRSPAMPRKSQFSPPASKFVVVPTPVGFRKIATEPARWQTTPTRNAATPTSRSTEDPLLWRIGEDYVVRDRLSLPLPPSEGYLRAIGPKSVHAERTLHFLSPQQHQATKNADRATRKQLSQQYGLGDSQRKERKSPVKSRMVINSITFDQKCYPIKRGVAFTTTPPHSARYYSHADSVGSRLESQESQQKQQQQQQSSAQAVLPMSVVLEPSKLTSVPAM